jgi:1-acyl-sn-glycerol-3-phosphate acyltransferase
VVDHSGLDPEEPVLVVSNHQGDFDIPVLLRFGGRPIAFVAKKELGSIPLISRWMQLLGCIFLDRDNRRTQVRQMRQTVNQLKEGLSMVIFPEGTRSRSPTMAPFAAGSLSLAEKAGVRILPVSLVDTYKLLPKGKWLLPGAKVTVVLHPPIQPADLSPEEKKSLHETVRAIIQTGLDEDVPG